MSDKPIDGPIDKLVDDLDQAIKNIWRYQTELDGDSEFARELTRRMTFVRHWYAVESDEGWLFAPSKFIGYEGNTARFYVERARRGRDGRVTEKTLKRLLETARPDVDDELRSDLQRFFEEHGHSNPNKKAKIHVLIDDERRLSLSEEDIVEAAMGQASAVDRLLRRPRPTKFSLEDFREARLKAEEIGRLGEALVDLYLRQRLKKKKITDYVWASDINAIEPYDFRVKCGGSWKNLEVKTTTGDFTREFHLSYGELCEMVRGDLPYRIVRVYEASGDGAKMRISRELREYGCSIIEVFKALPDGVTPNGVTIVPDETMFGDETSLDPLPADRG